MALMHIDLFENHMCYVIVEADLGRCQNVGIVVQLQS